MHPFFILAVVRHGNGNKVQDVKKHDQSSGIASHDDYVDENDEFDKTITTVHADNTINRRGNRNPNDKEKIRSVWEWHEVKLGMFAYVKYCGLWHAVLVTDKSPENNVVTAVHFAWPGWFSRRVVKEEKFVVDVENGDLKEVRIPESQRVSPGEAVERAKMQINEKNFNMITRRSSHLVRECLRKSDVVNSEAQDKKQH